MLPKKIREQIKAETFDVEVEKEKIILRRLKSIDEMCGSMSFLKNVNWRRMPEEECKEW